MSKKEISRRTFLKDAAIGAIGISALGVLAGCDDEPAVTPEPEVVEVIKEVEVPVYVEKTAPTGVVPANLAEVRASRVPACMGGPVLADGDYFVMRWLGNCSWEINYRNQVILLDNFYNRGPRAPITGVSTEQVTKADCIIISHAHKDHTADTAQVAKITGAPVYGHATVIEQMRAEGVPESQLFQFEDPDWNYIELSGVKISMIHTIHNRGGRDSSGFRPAINTYTEPTEETLAIEEDISSRNGGSYGDVINEGLFSYYIQFESGFTIFASESNARGYADGMKDFKDTLEKGVDIFFAPCQLGYNPILDLYEKKAVDLLEVCNPRLVMGQHHDVYPDFPMTSLVPLFQWIYDNRREKTDTYMQMYREPLVFDTVGQLGTGPIAPLPV